MTPFANWFNTLSKHKPYPCTYRLSYEKGGKSEIVLTREFQRKKGAEVCAAEFEKAIQTDAPQRSGKGSYKIEALDSLNTCLASYMVPSQGGRDANPSETISSQLVTLVGGVFASNHENVQTNFEQAQSIIRAWSALHEKNLLEIEVLRARVSKLTRRLARREAEALPDNNNALASFAEKLAPVAPALIREFFSGGSAPKGDKDPSDRPAHQAALARVLKTLSPQEADEIALAIYHTQSLHEIMQRLVLPKISADEMSHLVAFFERKPS